MGLTESHVQVSGDPLVRLFTARTDGPAEQTLLVIHGGPDWDHTYLRQPLCDLAGRRRVLFADLRGCGRSTRGLPSDQYTPDAAVADLLALLDAFDVREADVLGFSYGGLLAQRLTLTYPDRVRRLIVASSSILPVPPHAYDDWPQAAALRNRGPSPWEAAAEPTPELVRADAVASADVNVWRAAARPEYLRRVDEIRFSAEWAHPFVAGTLPSARSADTVARLAAVGLPMLLLHGRYDLGFPASLATQAAAEIPAALAVILPEAGHMAHIDAPGAWLAAVAGFLGT